MHFRALPPNDAKALAEATQCDVLFAYVLLL
jgi:hypothetical protein